MVREVTDPELLAQLEGRDTEPVAQKPVTDPALIKELDTDYSAVTGEVGPWDAFLIGAGRSFMTGGRMLGLVNEESPREREAYLALAEERPIATGLGEAAPFIAASVPVGGLGFGARVAGMTGLGAGEGAVIARSRGEDVYTGAGTGAAIAGGMEAMFPVIGRLARNIYRSVKGKPLKGDVIKPDGTPTDEMAAAMAAAGVSMDDLTEQAQKLIQTAPSGTDPEQLSRAARMTEMGAPWLKGDITQRTADQLEAERILSTGEDYAKPLEDVRLAQSRSVKDYLPGEIDVSGDIGAARRDVGGFVKEALEARESDIRGQAKDLYKAAESLAPELGDVPLDAKGLLDAMPQQRTMRQLSRLEGSQVKAGTELLKEFGVIADDEVAELIPLNLQNAEELRQGLVRAIRADKTGAAGEAFGNVVDALDDQLSKSVDLAKRAGIEDAEALGNLGRARELWKTAKTEFSPQSIAGRLTGKKSDKFTDIVEGSRVYTKLMAEPEEMTQRVISSLEKAGNEGQQAIKQMQGMVMMDLLEKATKASTRKLQGERVIGPGVLGNAIDKIGQARLDAVFKNDPAALRRINLARKAMEDLTTPHTAAQRGSAPALTAFFKRFGLMSMDPTSAAIGEILERSAKAGKNTKVLKKYINARPERKAAAQFMSENMPFAARAAGLGRVLGEKAAERLPEAGAIAAIPLIAGNE
jgi:hypothetical protein